MEDVKRKVSFESLDLGTTKPTSVPEETIHAIISASNLFAGYARAFINEAYRVNPLTAREMALKDEEIEKYIVYLLSKRIECVENRCKDFRRLKVLYIPAWIQFNLSMVGEVNIREKGLRIVPELEEEVELTFEQAVEISNRIGAFEDDLQILKDAMPRSIEGDRDVMTTALIAGYMRSIDKVEHVVSTYVAGFLGLKIREEAAMSVLYRVQYDDIAFIASALTLEKGLYR